MPKMFYDRPAPWGHTISMVTRTGKEPAFLHGSSTINGWIHIYLEDRRICKSWVLVAKGGPVDKENIRQQLIDFMNAYLEDGLVVVDQTAGIYRIK